MPSLPDIERSVYSQNGEDGVIEFLLRGVRDASRTFVEFGCGDGHENNTSHLAAQGYRGFVVDSKKARIARYRERAEASGWDVQAVRQRLTPANIPFIPFSRPDVFSLDIDSIDYWIFKALLEDGFRPRIACLEYNAAFGARAVTMPPNRKARHPKLIYFGCSVRAWRKLLEPQGFRFVTVESAGINAFFVDKREFDESLLDGFEGLEWADCPAIAEDHGPADKRFQRISRLPLREV